MPATTRAIIPIFDSAIIQNAIQTENILSEFSEISPNLMDIHGRFLRDVRISITDRCNFRCGYCMPKDIFGKDYPYLPHAALLSFEEIERLVRNLLPLGVRKVRLTGGEPLLRRGIEHLIEKIAAIQIPNKPEFTQTPSTPKAILGRGLTQGGTPLDITLTTNGSLLKRKARDLRAAGLQRLTVSLDALDENIFQRMNDVNFPASEVLNGIEAAQAAGFSNIKVNMVVKRSVNMGQILPMARHFRGTGIALRFIEYMDVGETNGWKMDEVVPSSEILSLLQQDFPLVHLAANSVGETAQRWGWANQNGQYMPEWGEIGFISSVTQAFCDDCNRLRISTDGKAYLCLFASQGWDLKTLLRNGSTDEQITAAVAKIWTQRRDQYSKDRANKIPSKSTPRIEMSYIGG